jgi:hypothetical protein
VPILPDVEAWPNKYVVVNFPTTDPANDSRTLAKVSSVLFSYTRPGILANVSLPGWQTLMEWLCKGLVGSEVSVYCRLGWFVLSKWACWHLAAATS